MIFYTSSKKLIPLILTTSLVFASISCGGGGSDDDNGSSPNSTPTPTGTVVADTTPEPQGKVWTVAEILGEPRIGGNGDDVRCGGEFGFKRCICAYDVPSNVRYRPAVAECNGNAAAILSGGLIDAVSIVVRDSQNRDRWPAAGSGYGGCSFELANSEDPPKRCSAFKVQDEFLTPDGSARVFCFGESGYSSIFRDVVRLTAKLNDVPNSNDDDIERYCLNGNDLPLN